MPPPLPSALELFSLESRRYLVCGAGNGIGAACTRVLAGLGADVLCVDRDPGLAEAIADDAGSQMGVLMTSSDFEELVRVCNRILVFRAGQVTHELEASSVGAQDLIELTDATLTEEKT